MMSKWNSRTFHRNTELLLSASWPVIMTLNRIETLVSNVFLWFIQNVPVFFCSVWFDLSWRIIVEKPQRSYNWQLIFHHSPLSKCNNNSQSMFLRCPTDVILLFVVGLSPFLLSLAHSSLATRFIKTFIPKKVLETWKLNKMWGPLKFQEKNSDYKIRMDKNIF